MKENSVRNEPIRISVKQVKLLDVNDFNVVIEPENCDKKLLVNSNNFVVNERSVNKIVEHLILEVNCELHIKLEIIIEQDEDKPIVKLVKQTISTEDEVNGDIIFVKQIVIVVTTSMVQQVAELLDVSVTNSMGNAINF